MARTISGHMIRRTARKKEQEIEKLRAVVRSGRAGSSEARQQLIDMGVRPAGGSVRVASTMRGPFGWRVEQD